MLNRKTEDIQELLKAIREAHGTDSIVPYGDSDDPLSVGFRIDGIPATFSVLVEDRLPEQHYNVQIESYPHQGHYLYCDRAVSLWGMVDLVKLLSGPRDNWP